MNLRCWWSGHLLPGGKRWPYEVWGGASWTMKIGPCVRCGHVWYPGRPNGGQEKAPG